MVRLAAGPVGTEVTEVVSDVRDATNSPHVTLCCMLHDENYDSLILYKVRFADQRVKSKFLPSTIQSFVRRLRSSIPNEICADG